MIEANEARKRWSAPFLQGIANGFVPMLMKELRTQARGWRMPALIGGYLLAVALGITGIAWVGRLAGMPPFFGLILFNGLAVGLLLLLAFVAPAVSANSISGERERRTLDLLLVSQASPLGVVLGKWAASILFLLLLLAASMPAFSLVYLYGGVPLGSLLMILLICAATAVTYGAMGVFLSTWFRRTQMATVTAYVLVFVLVFVSLVFSILHIERQRALEAQAPPTSIQSLEERPLYFRPPWLMYLSPLTALGSTMPGLDGAGLNLGIPVFSDVMYALMGYNGRHMSTQAIPVGVAPPGGVASQEGTSAEKPPWPAWAYHLLFDGAAVVFFLGASTLMLMPTKPWRRRRRSSPLTPSVARELSQ